MRRPLPWRGMAIALTALFLVSNVTSAHAEELEPRSFSANPIGTNFLILNYTRTTGGVSLDPVLPVTDVQARINYGYIGYDHTFALGKHTASLSFVLPYVQGDLTGQLKGQGEEVSRSGLGDLDLRFTWNLIGDPALTPKEFARRKPTTTFGMSLTIDAPTGSYNPAHLINISSNRWSFRPELGAEQPIQKWFVDGSAAATLYTDNNDFFGGTVRAQDPVWDFQAHVGYNFRPGMWLSTGATYYTGGEVSINGISTHTFLANSRYGFAFSAPIGHGLSAKLAWSRWLTGQEGSKFNTASVTLQYRWFDH